MSIFAQANSNSRSAVLLFHRPKACSRLKALYDNLTGEKTNYRISDGARLCATGNEPHAGTMMRLQKRDTAGPSEFYNCFATLLPIEASISGIRGGSAVFSIL